VVYPWDMLEDPAKTDIRFHEIESLKLAKSPSYPTNPAGRSNTILFFPPVHNTTNLLLYLIKYSRKFDMQMYGWDHKGIQDAIVARKLSQPSWDVKVLINRNGYMDGGETYDLVNSAPSLRRNDWFILGTGEGDTNGTYPNRIMHRKALIVDGCWFVHGSTNLDTSSVEYQGNTLSITYDPALCSEAQILFDRTRRHNLNKGTAWYQVP